MRWRMLFLVGLAGLAGCCTPAGYRAAYLGRPAPCDRCAAATQMAPAPLPSNPVVTPPVQSNFVPPSTTDPPFGRFIPDTGSHLYPPLPLRPDADDNQARARLLPPQGLPAPPKNTDLPPMHKPSTEEPPTYPADIPDFAIVQKKVANGKRPFTDGMQWLADNRYQTVLQIRLPADKDAKLKAEFEKRHLTFLSLEIDPRTLNKEVVDRFNQIVADEKNRPLFVFDEQGDLAGALWYLHFRTAEGMDDEKARTEASRLGFKQDREGPHRDMWIAVQNYLKNLNP